ncbi:MAG: helix-turn-helix domain-containing protein, partial [Dehalococcoidia bacterium]
MKTTATYVRGAERMLIRAELTPEGIRVRFADDREGMIPLVDLKLESPPKRVTLPDPFTLYIHLEGGETEEIPWDYARHFADEGYRERSEQAAVQGRRLFGERLGRLRREKGLSQAELAKRSGIARVTIARIETGEQSPRYETIIALAKGLDLSVNRLLLDDLVCSLAEGANKLSTLAWAEPLHDADLPPL